MIFINNAVSDKRCSGNSEMAISYEFRTMSHCKAKGRLVAKKAGIMAEEDVAGYGKKVT